MNEAIADKHKPLRYWLAQEDWYMSRYSREWLESTPHAQAANTLALLAEEANPEPHSLLHRMLGGIAACFATSDNIGGGGTVRRVGTRAALMLASLGDARCIPPLVRVFETNPSWRGKYQELVESAMIDFFLDKSSQPQLQEYAIDIRILASHIWNTGEKRRELSEPLTKLLIMTLRYLQESSDTSDLTTLRAITVTPSSSPNRLRVQKAAQDLLNSLKP